MHSPSLHKGEHNTVHEPAAAGVAKIVRCAGQAFLEHIASGSTGSTKKCCWPSRAAVLPRWADIAISARTAEILPLYNSCRNRHCPRCQGSGRAGSRRGNRNLLTRDVHAVFTLPLESAPSLCRIKRLIYNLLFHASAQTLLEIAVIPGILAEIGFFSVLHSWNQRLQFIPMSTAYWPPVVCRRITSRWISARRSFFLPIGVLRVFRGKFVAGLPAAPSIAA